MATYRSKKPETAVLNAALKKESEGVMAKADKAFAKAVSTAEKLQKQSECNHVFEEGYSDSYDGHRTDREYYWFCRKCEFTQRPS